jgi:molecular chaperone GrpE (heat shock protein)
VRRWGSRTCPSPHPRRRIVAVLKQRIDHARVDANLALIDVKQQVEQISDQVQTRWAQLKAEAFAWMDDIKAKIDKRADQRGARAAAIDADRAERDAADAIDYAVWAFFSARLTVLDALDARAYAVVSAVSKRRAS